MKEVIKVGVLGVGSLGQHHARNYGDMPDCDLVGVCDIDLKAAQRVASKCSTEAYPNHQELMEKIDAVSIVVPTVYHHAMATEFLEAGIHVLVEKPITSDLVQARELIDLAMEHNIRPITETFSLDKVNEAHDRLRANTLRYRAVLVP